jgi:hypothetical protein
MRNGFFPLPQYYLEVLLRGKNLGGHYKAKPFKMSFISHLSREGTDLDLGRGLQTMIPTYRLMEGPGQSIKE